MKMLRRIIVLFSLFLSNPALFADAPENYPFVSYDQAMQQAQDASKPIFVYFGRYGCGYCDKTNKEAFSVPKVKEIFTNHYILAYVDSESGTRLRLPSGERITERELGVRYKASVSPVFSFISMEGKLLHRLIGVQNKESLLEADKKVQKFLSENTLK